MTAKCCYYATEWLHNSNMKVISQSIVISGAIERVYQAIANADDFAKWFSESVEGDFSVGSTPIIDEGKYGKFRLAIIAAEPPSYFAWRWVSGMAFVPQGFVGDVLSHPNTLVEFFLESVEGGTRVTVKESGWESLPDSYRDQNFEDNTGGWEFQLAACKKFVESE